MIYLDQIFGADAVTTLAIFALVFLISIFFLRRLSASWPTQRYKSNRWREFEFNYGRKFRPLRSQRLNVIEGGKPNLGDVGNQIKIVMASAFEKRRLLSPDEFRIFRIIEQDAVLKQNGLRVFAQTSLGEILKSQDPDAYSCINSKRVDLLIVDRSGFPILAIEYQGNGHFLGTAAARDAVKKEALRKAGVRYIEVFPNDSAEQVTYRVHEQLGWGASPPKSTDCA